MKDFADTPMMRYYRETKQRYPEMVLLFRVGDFYEAFDDDAKLIADVLGLTVTHRGTTAMAGFPCHFSNQYLIKLLNTVTRVVFCQHSNDTP